MPREIVWEVTFPPPQFDAAVARAWYCRGKPDGEYLALVWQAFGSERCATVYQLAFQDKVTETKHPTFDHAREHIEHVLSTSTVVPRKWS